MTSFKFFKHKDGISVFAVIGLEPIAESGDLLEWAPDMQAFESTYGEAVALGIRDALAWHMPQGGFTMGFRVLKFTELLVDTKPDAVRCAATMAAWKALGHERLVSPLSLSMNGGRFEIQDAMTKPILAEKEVT